MGRRERPPGGYTCGRLTRRQVAEDRRLDVEPNVQGLMPQPRQFMRPRNLTARSSFLLRVAYATCLLIGTATHVWTIATHGLFWDYDGAPFISRIYWISLTLLDPLAALLLFALPRIGLTMTLAIITSDVVHNTWVMSRSPAPDWLNFMYVAQVLFLVFVFASFRHAWPGLRQS